MYKFTSTLTDRGSFNDDWPAEFVKNEPMFFSASLSYALDHGGKITRSFIGSLPSDWQLDTAILDSRVHMLMPGWYPCIPGYHHDDVPRGPSGQPDYETPAYRSEHLMGLVNGDICPTLFAIGTHELPKIDRDIIYKKWDPIVREQIANGQLRSVTAASGRYLQFDDRACHTGQQAVYGGWRWFVRVSRGSQRPVTNEIRRQCQVYLEFPMEGW